MLCVPHKLKHAKMVDYNTPSDILYSLSLSFLLGFCQKGSCIQDGTHGYMLAVPRTKY